MIHYSTTMVKGWYATVLQRLGDDTLQYYNGWLRDNMIHYSTTMADWGIIWYTTVLQWLIEGLLTQWLGDDTLHYYNGGCPSYSVGSLLIVVRHGRNMIHSQIALAHSAHKSSTRCWNDGGATFLCWRPYIGSYGSWYIKWLFSVSRWASWRVNFAGKHALPCPCALLAWWLRNIAMLQAVHRLLYRLPRPVVDISPKPLSVSRWCYVSSGNG